MTRIIFILSILITGLASAQINQVDSNGKKQGTWGKQYDGKRVFMYQGKFKDDKPVGKFVYKYPSNKVKAIILHSETSSRSEAFMYHENGKLMSHGIYRNQLKDSVWTHYGPSERLSFKETYTMGKLNGLKTTYYIPELMQDKRIVKMQELTYVNGDLNGPTKEFFNDGVTKMEGRYVNNLYDGHLIYYHPNGRKQFSIRYKNGNKHGWWITYNNQGKEIARKYFYNGSELKGEKLKAHMAKLKAEGKSPNE